MLCGTIAETQKNHRLALSCFSQALPLVHVAHDREILLRLNVARAALRTGQVRLAKEQLRSVKAHP